MRILMIFSKLINFRSTLKNLSNFSDAATLVLRPYQGFFFKYLNCVILIYVFFSLGGEGHLNFGTGRYMDFIEFRWVLSIYTARPWQSAKRAHVICSPSWYNNDQDPGNPGAAPSKPLPPSCWRRPLLGKRPAALAGWAGLILGLWCWRARFWCWWPKGFIKWNIKFSIPEWSRHHHWKCSLQPLGVGEYVFEEIFVFALVCSPISPPINALWHILN